MMTIVDDHDSGCSGGHDICNRNDHDGCGGHGDHRDFRMS